MERISARLTDGAAGAWDRTCTREGVTLTALLEALGQAIALDRWHPPVTVVTAAKQIDRERRSRS